MWQLGGGRGAAAVLVLLLALVLFPGLFLQKKKKKRAHTPVTIVFVPGLFGTELSNKNAYFPQTSWISLASVLKTRCFRPNTGHNIPLPLTWTASKQDKDGLTPTKPIYTYAAWLKFCKKINSSSSETGIGCTFFAWDFRRSLEEASAQFEVFVKTLGETKIVLVSHSTGSMVVAPIINQNPSLFQAWFSVGGAMGPGPNALGEDLNANAPGWRIESPVNVCLLSQATRRTFTTLYGFHAATAETALLDVATNKPVEGDLYDMGVWEKLMLGPWAGGAAVSQEMHDHVKNALANGKAFRKRIDGEKEILAHPTSNYEHLKVVVYGSDSFKTLSVLNWREGKGITEGDVAVWTDGDGTIQGQNWRRAFGGLEGDVVLSGMKHAELPNDAHLHNLVLEAAMAQNRVADCVRRNLLVV